MLVRFLTNLGSNDAARFSLDFRACCKGMELQVSDAAGEWLVRKGLAAEVAVKAVAKPAELKAESKPAPLTGRGKPSDKPTPDKES